MININPLWGAEVERQAFGRRDQDSKPPAISKLGKFFSPHFACSFGRDTKAVGPFYLVSMPGEVKDPMQGNGKYLLFARCTS